MFKASHHLPELSLRCNKVGVVTETWVHHGPPAMEDPLEDSSEAL